MKRLLESYLHRALGISAAKGMMTALDGVMITGLHEPGRHGVLGDTVTGKLIRRGVEVSI